MDPRSPVGSDLKGRQNDPPLLILLSLADGDKHGHALAKDIEQMAGVRLGPGTLYGAIARLEDRGLIEPLGTDGRRRPYRLTGDGLRALTEAVAELRRLADAGDRRLASAAGRARRADLPAGWAPA
jgi:DNA-binding PadR family transcriptional regulator